MRLVAKILDTAAIVPKSDGVGNLLGRIEALLDAQDALAMQTADFGLPLQLCIDTNDALCSYILPTSNGRTRTLYQVARRRDAVKRERNPARSPKYSASATNDFCVCRVLVGCALVTIKSLNKLRTAKRYMQRTAAHVPGSYVVFSKRSRQVLGKVVR
jgi:hypothetical protein